MTDATGATTLVVAAANGGFYGHLSITDPSDPVRISPAVIARSAYAPFRDGELVARAFVGPGVLDGFCALVDGGCASDSVPLTVVVRDCQYQSARGIEVVTPGGAELLGYFTLTAGLDTLERSTGSTAGTAALAVRAGRIEVEARHAQTGVRLARGTVAIEPGTQGSIDLVVEPIDATPDP